MDVDPLDVFYCGVLWGRGARHGGEVAAGRFGGVTGGEGGRPPLTHEQLLRIRSQLLVLLAEGKSVGGGR